MLQLLRARTVAYVAQRLATQVQNCLLFARSLRQIAMQLERLRHEADHVTTQARTSYPEASANLRTLPSCVVDACSPLGGHGNLRVAILRRSKSSLSGASAVFNAEKFHQEILPKWPNRSGTLSMYIVGDPMRTASFFVQRFGPPCSTRQGE